MPIIRFCLHHGLVSPETPLLPSNEATLIHFATHLSNTVSYGTIKVYLAAVKNLHTEFGFPLDFTSMPLLYKTLRGIVCLQSVPKRMRYPITIMVLTRLCSRKIFRAPFRRLAMTTRSPSLPGWSPELIN